MPLSFKRSLRFVWSMWHCASWIQPQGNTMWPNWATAKATLGMKNALEQDLVTNSGREPDSSLFLSFYSSSCLCSCPGLRGQALLPCSPVTGAEATNSCTQSHISSTKGRRRLPAVANAGHSHKSEEPSVHLQPSSRHDLRFLTFSALSNSS